jgi:hypothetical protein
VTDEVLDRLGAALPELFAHAVAALHDQADRGDASAHERLEQIAGAPAAAFVQLRGAAGELRFVSEGLALVARADFGTVTFGHGLGLSAAAAQYALLVSAQERAALEPIGRAWAVLVSPAARGLFATASYGFELVVTGVPGAGELRLSIGLGRPTLPSKPEFVLTAAYDELEDAREQKLPPQQLFLAGKLRIDGDVAKAMMLGMTLAQLR